jgi:hypothetical protein
MEMAAKCNISLFGETLMLQMKTFPPPSESKSQDEPAPCFCWILAWLHLENGGNMFL